MVEAGTILHWVSAAPPVLLEDLWISHPLSPHASLILGRGLALARLGPTSADLLACGYPLRKSFRVVVELDGGDFCNIALH